ncbi:N-acetylglutamate synthase-like GNAT family acetyltransferase [Paenibacillus taihuensis]|uniref:N-acetylglutamate synthase-like GNAT family acetyltransferase n=1 Tax=Paenibacillus taihuensis TaxID=1156355 RepID=A0A3D9SKX0_9BACL|nr:GNAT family N-acetyltransferase [Paenibacillus taihuensis]REE94543.1 N-acetylglutamate synthase-like GNAT family acetyltransferase [Paenibacillus taihuensis]
MIRQATLDEIKTIVELKIRMFEEAGIKHYLKAHAESSVYDKYCEMYRNFLGIHFVMEEEGRIVACAGAFLKSDIPYCFYEPDQYGFIGDIYVMPEYRKRGFARRLTEETIGWLQACGVKTIRLLASPDGRHLYETMGFKPTHEMELKL